MVGNGRARSGAEWTEVPVAVPCAQIRAKVELSREEDQPKQKGENPNLVTGAEHAYSLVGRKSYSVSTGKQNGPSADLLFPAPPAEDSPCVAGPGARGSRYFFATNVFASASSGRSAPEGQTSVSFA